MYLKIHEQNEKFPEDLLGNIVVAILNALSACEDKDIVHRNVTPENILLNFKGQIKLADFGDSKILSDSLATSVVGIFLKFYIAYFLIQEHYTIGHPKDLMSTSPSLIYVAMCGVWGSL